MRKVVAGLIMVGIIGFYVFHLMNVGKGEESTQNKTQEVNHEENKSTKKEHGAKGKKTLEEYKSELEKEYPSTPGEVMAIYNELLEVAYDGTMTEEETAIYVKIVRMFYTEAFKSINPEETQLKNLKHELEYNKENAIRMVTSSVGPIYILTDGNGNETQAYITVTHAMNVKSDVRKYLFCKENGYWKINGWESVQSTVAEE